MKSQIRGECSDGSESSVESEVHRNLEKYKTEQYRVCKQVVQQSGKKVIGLYGIISDSIMRNYKLYVNQLKDSQHSATNRILHALEDKEHITKRLRQNQKNI